MVEAPRAPGWLTAADPAAFGSVRFASGRWPPPPEDGAPRRPQWRGGRAPVGARLIHKRSVRQSRRSSWASSSAATFRLQTRSLRELPNSRILIGWGPRLLFGNVSVDEIETRALAIVESVRSEVDAEFDAWVSEAEEQMISQAVDEALGK